MLSSLPKYLASDSSMPMLDSLSLEKIQQSLARFVPAGSLDSNPYDYRLNSMRYSPQSKLVLGLVSHRRQRPVAIRVFPEDVATRRYQKAYVAGQRPVFLLEDVGAVAWIFPGERKLDLRVVEDKDLLHGLLKRDRGFHPKHTELVHYVPEHTYTLQATGIGDERRNVTEFVKVYYDDSGVHVANVASELAMQSVPGIEVAVDCTYWPDHRMTAQASLARDTSRRVTDAEAAYALAVFHGMSSASARTKKDDAGKKLDETVTLTSRFFPSAAGSLRELCDRLGEKCLPYRTDGHVLIHGDAHLGNFFPLQNGDIGIIDLDSVQIGRPEKDLAAYFAFSLWLQLRSNSLTEHSLGRLPSFVAVYNRYAKMPVTLCDVYLHLAAALITERIRRGITRGKLGAGNAISEFLRLAWACFIRSEELHA